MTTIDPVGLAHARPNYSGMDAPCHNQQYEARSVLCWGGPKFLLLIMHFIYVHAKVQLCGYVPQPIQIKFAMKRHNYDNHSTSYHCRLNTETSPKNTFSSDAGIVIFNCLVTILCITIPIVSIVYKNYDTCWELFSWCDQDFAALPFHQYFKCL